jgi:glycosyltransferase involved in cell wall biosynthesis
MSKPYLVYSAPVATVSGYGEHARDILRSLKELDKFDIQIVSQKWGETPMNALDPSDEFHRWMIERLTTMVNGKLTLQKQPDVWIQVTVPNEFQRIGRYNIGITAGMETSHVHSDWIEGINRMDLNIVTSEHSKNSLLNSVYIKKDSNNNIETELKVSKPIEVLFEGFDESIFFDKNHKLNDNLLLNELSNIKEDFAFLFVGHWLKGDFGHDRKDVATLIKTFCETFKNIKNKPALLLKTSGGTFSVMDRETTMKKIRSITSEFGDDCPNVYLLHGELTHLEMNNLYNHPKVKAMVSFTKGEGFGRPLLEFTQSGKPIIASNWSGHIDFLHQKESILVGGTLQNIHPSSVWDKVIIPESKWFYIDTTQAKAAMKDLYKNYDKYKKLSESLKIRNKKFTLNSMKQKFDEILTNNLPEFPKEIELKLPKLKKIN